MRQGRKVALAYAWKWQTTEDHMNIIANVSKMFFQFDPGFCSASQAELGPNAGKITWRNALSVAERHEDWLVSNVEESCEGMREWAKDTGAWDQEERDAWSVEECLALFVQNVASELRMLGSDDYTLEQCAEKCASTDWGWEPEYPIGYYMIKGDHVEVDYYTGV